MDWSWPTIASVGASLLAALAATTSAALLWADLRRRHRESAPIVECEVSREGERAFQLFFVVRNKLAESIRVERARVVRPHGARITIERQPDGGGGSSGFLAPTETEIAIGYRVAPVGTEPQGFAANIIGNSQKLYFEVFVEMPEAWRSGELRIDLCISTQSAETRERWIAVRRSIQETKTRATPATAHASD